ncbi:MAG: hypothetical protein ACFFCW_26275 [Candidatus Hodarchaeota archaeon]
MNWIVTNKDLLAVLIAAASLVVSIIAVIRTNRTASLTAKLQRSNILSELHDKICPGRQAMESIWTQWSPSTNKDVESLSPSDEEQFIDFYNAEYHKSSDERNKDLSNRIHVYLDELHSVWDRIERKEFDLEEVMRKLGDGIFLDRPFIRIYLKAHWKAEGQLEKSEKDRFWNNVSKIVDAAESWKNI